MSTMRWLPAVVLLAAGFLGGYLVGSAEMPAGGGNDELAAEPEAAGESGKALSSESVGPTLETSGDPHGLHAVLERIPPPEIPSGEGRITGRVVDAADQPIAGARVVAVPDRPAALDWPSWAERQRESLAVLIERTIARRRWRELAGREAMTGADGCFEVTGLADVAHAVSVSHEHYQFQAQDGKAARAARPGALLEFTGKGRVAVTSDVFLPDGSTPRRASVTFRGRSGTREIGWRPSYRTVRADPGTYTVTATADDRSYVAERQQVTLELGVPARLTFHLQGAPTVKGTVLAPAADTMRSAVVSIARLAPGVEPEQALLLSSDEQAWVHFRRGRREGAFQFERLTVGRYLVGVSRFYGGEILAQEIVDVGQGPAHVEFELPPLPREDYAIVSVYDPDGKRLTGADVTTGHESARHSSSHSVSPIERPDGTLWVLHHRVGAHASAERGVYWIQVSVPEHGVLRQTYQPGPAVALEFRFQRTAPLEMTIQGLVGTRYEGRVQVSVSAPSIHPGSQVIGIDAEGRGTLEGLQPGTYLITGVLANRADAVLFKQEVAVTTSGASMTVTMPALHVVAVRGAAEICRLVQAKGHLARSCRVGSDGKAVFDAVLPGEYTVRSGSKSRTFSVPGTTDVDLR